MLRPWIQKKPLVIAFLLLLAGLSIAAGTLAMAPSFSFTEAEFEPDDLSEPMIGRYSLVELERWTRPPGPPRVAIQAGHWKNNEVPDELQGLKDNGGATGGNVTERAVVLTIAERMVAMLTEQGVVAELLPTTIPPGYVADAFVSIHADGSLDTSVSGYKVAAPRRDYSGASTDLANRIGSAYGAATGLRKDENITSRMRGYYAFNWRRYEHAIHPMTPAAIVETGFVTNASDRRLLSGQPDHVAAAVVSGIMDFLTERNLLPVPEILVGEAVTP